MSDSKDMYYQKAIDYVAVGYRCNSEAILVEVAKRDPELYCAAIDTITEEARIEKEKQERIDNGSKEVGKDE